MGALSRSILCTITRSVLLAAFFLHFPVISLASAPSYCKVNGGEYICTEPETRVGDWNYGGFAHDTSTFFCFNGWPRAQCLAQQGEWNSCAGGCKNIQIPLNRDTLVQIAEDSVEINVNPCSVQMQEGNCGGSSVTWGNACEYQYIGGAEEQIEHGVVTRQSRDLEFSGTKPAGDCDESFQTEMIANRARSVTQHCPPGYESDHVEGVKYCRRHIDASCPLGNPVRPGTGEKVHAVTDFRAPQSQLLRVERSYSSFGFYRSTQGGHDADNLVRFNDHWRFNWNKTLEFIEDSTNVMAVAVRPGGQLDYIGSDGKSIYRYDGSYSRLIGVRGVYGSIIAWDFRTRNGLTERYDLSGRLVWVQNQGIDRIDIHYDASDRPTLIEHVSGRVIALGYDGNGRVEEITLSDGNQLAYTWDAKNRLTRVAFPDGTSRTYHWEDSAFPYALTGITDELGNRYATYSYDSNGRVAGTERMGQVDAWSYSYTQSSINVITPAGANIGLTKSTQGGIVRITDTTDKTDLCPGLHKHAEYNSFGLPTETTDFNGDSTMYGYDGDGLENQRVEAAGTPHERTMTTTWDSNLQKPTEIIEANKKTSFTYNSRGQVLTRTIAEPSPEGPDADPTSGGARTWTYNYCAGSDGQNSTVECPIVGLLVSMDGPRTDVSDVTEYFYYTDNAADSSHRIGDLRQLVDAAGNVTEYLAYDGAGRVLEMKDPNGIQTSFAYDSRGRLVSRILHHPGTGLDDFTVLEYDAVGNLIKITQPDGSTIAYEYDAAHRLTAIEDALGNRIEYTLDNAGNRVAERIKGPSGSTFRQQTREYDTLNRLVKEINGVGDETTHAYDAQGNRTSTTDPAGNVTTHQYDALNRLTASIDALNGFTDYTHDVQDRLARVTDPRGIATDYVYDGLGNILEEASPDAGTSVYSYDDAGNRIRRIDARGQITDYEFDVLNRLSAVHYENGDSTTYGYDAGTNGKGRLTSIAEPDKRINYQYTFRGHRKLDKRTFDTPGITLTTRYYYNRTGRQTSQLYPSGARVYWPRQHANRDVKTVRVDIGGEMIILAADITHAPFGPVTGFTYGNGTAHTRSFDLAGRRVSYQTGDDGPAFLSYDASGNIRSWQSATHNSYDQTFAYDAQNRLIEAEGQYGTLQYAYDDVGNRVQHSHEIPNQGTSSTDYTFALDSNRLLHAGDKAYGYDAAGSPTQIGDRILTYNEENRIAVVEENGTTVATYSYNALGQRDVKHTPHRDIYSVYDLDGRLIGEYDEQGSAIREYIYLEGEPLAMLRPDDGHVDIFYFQTDHRGAAQSLFAHEGNVGSGVRYMPFGRVYGQWQRFESDPNDNNTQPDGNPPDLRLRYPGQYEDIGTGLYYNYFRTYNPDTGRYLTSDPIGLDGGINIYAYAELNPIIKTDELGLAPSSGDYRWSECSPEDMRVCISVCSPRKVESCRRRWIRATEISGGVPVRGWKRGELSCNCEESFCEENTTMCAIGAGTGAVITFILRAGASCLITVGGT